MAEDPRTKRCRSCKAAIVFLKTRTGKTMPIDADTVEPGDEFLELGKHVSHFATCPDATYYRKPR